MNGIDGVSVRAVYDDDKCVCAGGRRRVLMHVCVVECVYMMMMNGGHPLHALPVSTARKHREMIWVDTLSCSLMQLYILSTK